MKKIEFVSYDEIKKKKEIRKKIEFIPNIQAQRVLRSNHSDINELKSYLKQKH